MKPCRKPKDGEDAGERDNKPVERPSPVVFYRLSDCKISGQHGAPARC